MTEVNDVLEGNHSHTRSYLEPIPILPREIVQHCIITNIIDLKYFLTLILETKIDSQICSILEKILYLPIIIQTDKNIYLPLHGLRHFLLCHTFQGIGGR